MSTPDISVLIRRPPACPIPPFLSCIRRRKQARQGDVFRYSRRRRTTAVGKRLAEYPDACVYDHRHDRGCEFGVSLEREHMYGYQWDVGRHDLVGGDVSRAEDVYVEW
jgi:hypothetical protein